MIYKFIPIFGKLMDLVSYPAKSRDASTCNDITLVNSCIVRLVSLLFIYVIDPNFLFNFLIVLVVISQAE